MAGQPQSALAVLEQVLQRWPRSGFAQVHYGFILKTTANDLERAVEYLRAGIDTREQGVIDGRFYYQLGDALNRLGRHDEAQQVSALLAFCVS